MARIPDTEIERLKNEISLERLAESQGIELKLPRPLSRDATARCRAPIIFSF